MKLLNCLKYGILVFGNGTGTYFLPHKAEELALSLKKWMTTLYQHPEVIAAFF
jgi:hypothetical protein